MTIPEQEVTIDDAVDPDGELMTRVDKEPRPNPIYQIVSRTSRRVYGIGFEEKASDKSCTMQQKMDDATGAQHH